MSRKIATVKSKGAGRTGIKRFGGGWNKGQRYGSIVTPDELVLEPVVKNKNAQCICGVCLLCTRRIYRRVWGRKARANAHTDDAELDRKAQEWLMANKFR